MTYPDKCRFLLVDNEGTVIFSGEYEKVKRAKRVLSSNVMEVTEEDEVVLGAICYDASLSWVGSLKAVTDTTSFRKETKTFTEWAMFLREHSRLIKSLNQK